ncbi:hypothetical protein GCM10010245_54050 [Streptomyces spectabilis]|nr:hypothetical protein GCM10010245_54050 [Streptomyces spectabilis]
MVMDTVNQSPRPRGRRARAACAPERGTTWPGQRPAPPGVADRAGPRPRALELREEPGVGTGGFGWSIGRGLRGTSGSTRPPWAAPRSERSTPAGGLGRHHDSRAEVGFGLGEFDANWPFAAAR